jgi:N-acetylmuramic acid 6-phosphate etherase
MIQLGRVKGNRMVDMKITNDKLAQRGINMLQQELKINFEEAEELLKQYKNVREAISIYLKKNSYE